MLLFSNINERKLITTNNGVVSFFSLKIFKVMFSVSDCCSTISAQLKGDRAFAVAVPRLWNDLTSDRSRLSAIQREGSPGCGWRLWESAVRTTSGSVLQHLDARTEKSFDSCLPCILKDGRSGWVVLEAQGTDQVLTIAIRSGGAGHFWLCRQASGF